jgi:hypothetical protein
MYACTAQYSTGQYAFPEECQKITSWTMAEGGFVRGVCRQAARYGQQGHWTGTGASIQGRPGGWGRQQRRKGAKIIPDNHAAERITAKIQKFHLNRELLCPYSPPQDGDPCMHDMFVSAFLFATWAWRFQSVEMGINQCPAACEHAPVRSCPFSSMSAVLLCWACLVHMCVHVTTRERRV